MASASSAFVNPPRLPSPTHGRIHARKPSRSPTRHHVRHSDALLRDLSPTATLRAFVTDPSEMADSSDALVASIRSATMAERSLGAKAAQTCLDLRNWTREIEQWQWPNTFAAPAESSSVRSSITKSDANDAYWGSLPASLVQEYEERADEIGQALDEIDVEELKDYVLNSHYRVNSRPPSRLDGAGEHDLHTTTDLKKLDDFTALVTATILQALPFLTRLNRLLDVWTIRLIILRSAPRFIDDLRRAKLELKNCWTAISSSPGNTATGVDSTNFTRATMKAMQSSLEQQIGRLGKRLDRFLDNLEGRSDCVPDEWIDDFESLEAEYGSFVVQAERTVYENEWRQQRQSIHSRSEKALAPTGITSHNGTLTVSETEDPLSDDDAIRRPSQSIRSSVDESQLAELSVDTSTPTSIPVASEVVELSANEPWATGNRSVSAPLKVMPQSQLSSATDSNSGGLSRSASTNDREKEETSGSVAAKRAAFLRDIERNQSLNKSTQSPVRPFERASNAFTRLFKKDKNTEEVPLSRSGSRLANGRNSSAERAALSPVSFASSRFNSVSPTMSTQSGANSSKSSVNETESSDTSRSTAKRSDHSTQGNSQNASHARWAMTTSGAEHSILQQKSSNSFVSPTDEPRQEEFPDGWPLSHTSEPKQQPSSAEPAPAHNAAQPMAAMAVMNTDDFDKTFVQSFAPHTSGKPKDSENSSSSTRRASLAPPPEFSESLPVETPETAQWAPVTRDERRASTSPSRPRTAPSQPELQSVTGTKPSPVDAETSDVEAGSTYKVKRASIASIEAFSRSELKSIDVPKSSRHSSVSSRRSPSRTPVSMSRRASAIADEGKRASVDNGAVALGPPIPPTPPPRRSSLPSQPSPSSNQATPEISRSSPVVEQAPESPLAPLNVAMKKLRGNKSTRRESAASVPDYSPIGSPSMPPVLADSFDRHVSEVLETLPASIRFKSRAGAETPTSRPRGYSGPRPKAATLRVIPKGEQMTIAPVDGSPRKARSAAEPEVKLYHLTHSGREDPIKLFVRLVGEGERVMVRVGGGWADLADYLRDFANHHGSRTVSEGNLEVAALPTVPGSMRKSSNPAEYIRAKTPTPMTPRESHRPGSSDDDEMPLKRPPLDSRETASSLSAASPFGGDHPATTPKSSKSSSSGSRPSTAGASRPSSRQTQAPISGDVGLSGPSSATKRGGLPADKERWVEGMIERAKKSASAEKSKEEKEKYFGELGKAGGTRRVIFRSGSGTGPFQDRTNR
ncbi:hypothetical protein CKM354_000409100 [Cercospora kikuchii]|uniref:GAR domain-containing protein n=1 Tax=Cercospora kikuchii TaxID=84275 RepID=A0A9P3CAU0_9PEZI|nr:uncharacterized protein CKM354_000409100 [Cercospora kikuchii]GIZ40764.1 hypothetical protein CKM354_000409100 [Cercospora kikuchii]